MLTSLPLFETEGPLRKGEEKFQFIGLDFSTNKRVTIPRVVRWGCVSSQGQRLWAVCAQWSAAAAAPVAAAISQ